MVQYFYCFYSYHGLLELWYGDKSDKTLATKEQVSRDGLSIREMEQCMDAEMFLEEYPHWEARGLHCPQFFREMFLQATHLGQKEVEQMIHQGC